MTDRDRHALLPAAAVAPLNRRSDARGCLRLAGHVGLLALTATGIAATLGTGWMLPAMLLHGIVQVALFAGLHETVHYTAFRRRWLNDGVATVIGLVHVLPARFFRRFHTAHHRHTQDPARDPELAGPKPATTAAYLLYVSGFRYWRDRLGELARHAAGRVDDGFVPVAERGMIAREARLHLAAYAAVLAASIGAGSAAALWFWVLPAVLGQPFLRLYLLAEHTGCIEDPDDMVRNTRTTFADPLVRFLMWNMPFHTEHHAYPAVPFHALPRLHALMRDRLAVTAPGYGAFHRTYLNALRAGGGAAFVHPAAGPPLALNLSEDTP